MSSGLLSSASLNLSLKSESGFSQFSQYFLDERVDLVCNSSKELRFADGRYLDRLGREVLEVDRGGFWGLMCFAAKVVSLAKTKPEIPFVCRGSAGSSLLCYLVGITDIDPVCENLALDRFLGGGRDKPPDIDLDFPSEMRPALWNRVREVYGDSIGFVATKLRYRSRGALREALRRCGIEYSVWVSSLVAISNAQRDRVLSLASYLEGKEYGLARHCGGIVYFPDQSSPPFAYCSARARDPFTQLLLDKEDLKRVGLPKLDILSNHGLSHLRAMGLSSSLGKDPMDLATGKIFSEGNTWGILQGESPAMRKIFLNLGFSTLQGVTLALGLVRPATGGLKSGGSEGSKLGAVGRNPIERRLIYEDDVTEFLAVVLGSSSSLAEFSRRTLLKGGEEAKKLLEDMERIVNRKGKDKVFFKGEHWTWSQIKKQLGLASSYAFCKAHATAYGRVLWALGRAKAHSPELFWSAFMSTALPSSMYLPWVYFERVKSELGAEVVWPGDMGLKVSDFFTYRWKLSGGKFFPDVEGERGASRGTEGGACFQGSIWESLGISGTWGSDSDLWKRQLRAAGFWSGCKGPIKGTYFDIDSLGEYMFYALRALRAPRFHPLGKKKLCAFETLGFGSLKVIEYSRVYEESEVPLNYDFSREFLSSKGRGRVKELRNIFYLSL